MDRCATRVHPPWIFLLLPLGKSSRVSRGDGGSILGGECFINENWRSWKAFFSFFESVRKMKEWAKGWRISLEMDLGIGGKIPCRILRTFHDQLLFLFGIRSRIPNIFGLYSYVVRFFNSPKFSTRSSWISGIKRKISKIIPKLVFNPESNPIPF